jgi:hypothetical protein
VEWCAMVVTGDERWWFDSQSSLTCEVVVGHSRYQWRAAEDCWTSRGEPLQWVSVCVTVVLLFPPHSDGVYRFEWWCASSSCWVAILRL